VSNRRVIRLKGSDIVVPDGMRLELAEEIAERLLKRLAAIESDSGKVDTIGFALQLAFDSMVQLHGQAASRQADVVELVKSLAQLNDELEAFLKQH
jgi:hypothetical protein